MNEGWPLNFGQPSSHLPECYIGSGYSISTLNLGTSGGDRPVKLRNLARNSTPITV